MLLKDKHIMVVDDDMGNIAVITAILMREGAKVNHDYWGSTALQTIIQLARKLDLILLDLNFPRNVSGYDIFDQLRAIPELNHVRIVAVTASDRDTEMPKVIQKGFNGFFNKPLDRRRFPQLLADILAGKEVWDE